MNWREVATDWLWAVSERGVSETAQLLHLTGLPVQSSLFHPDHSIQPQLGLLGHCLCSSCLIHCHQSACCSGDKLKYCGESYCLPLISASISKCVCLLPPQCFKGGSQLYCVKMGSSTSEKTVSICEVGAIRCANRKVEILYPGRCSA